MPKRARKRLGPTQQSDDAYESAVKDVVQRITSIQKAIDDVNGRTEVTTILTDEWIPVPPAILAKLGWKDDDELELVPFHNGEQLVVRRKGMTLSKP